MFLSAKGRNYFLADCNNKTSFFCPITPNAIVVKANFKTLRQTKTHRKSGKQTKVDQSHKLRDKKRTHKQTKYNLDTNKDAMSQCRLDSHLIQN